MVDRLSPGEGDADRFARVGGSIEVSSIAIRIYGDVLIPEDITRRLRVEPSKAYRKGDSLPSRHRPKIAQTGAWILNGNPSPSMALQDQVLQLLARFPDDLHTWSELRAQFEIDMWLGLVLVGNNPKFELSRSVLQELAWRGIEVQFDMYPTEYWSDNDD